jgi:hypothetical protein
VVRKGAGQELENDTQKLTLNDVKPVLDGRAKDMRASFWQPSRKAAESVAPFRALHRDTRLSS